jgi:hypothetical protein
VYGEVPPEIIVVNVAVCPTSADAVVGAAWAVKAWATVNVTVFEFAVCPPESVTLQ